MKIVNTFIFGEAHEADLLYLKLKLEDHLICEWIITECSYTFKGVHKGFLARKIINSDDRFKKFVPKIKIIEVDENLGISYRENKFRWITDKRHYFYDYSIATKTILNNTMQRRAFYAQNRQRELAKPYFMKNYKKDAYLIISDTDEMFDFTCSSKIESFCEEILSRELTLFNVPRMKFCYDFDNYSFQKRFVPIISRSRLSSISSSFLDLRTDISLPILMLSDKLCFEYSFCFDLTAMRRKLTTVAASGFTNEDLDLALKANHRLLRKLKYRELTSNEFFHKIKLNKQNSPKYIRDNLDRLRTNNVNEAYCEYRLNNTIV